MYRNLPDVCLVNRGMIESAIDRFYSDEDLRAVDQLDVCMCMADCHHTLSATTFSRIGKNYEGKRLKRDYGYSDRDENRRILIFEVVSRLARHSTEEGYWAYFDPITGLRAFTHDVRKVYAIGVVSGL